jgi:hypothetical protein
MARKAKNRRSTRHARPEAPFELPPHTQAVIDETKRRAGAWAKQMKEAFERGEKSRAERERIRQAIDRHQAIRDGLIPPPWMEQSQQPEKKPRPPKPRPLIAPPPLKPKPFKTKPSPPLQPPPRTVDKSTLVDRIITTLKVHPEWRLLYQDTIVDKLKKQGVPASRRSLNRALAEMKKR